MRRIASSGAELVLCGHDHHEAAHLIDGRVVVSTAGTLSARLRGGVPSFNLISVETSAITITFYRWAAESQRFRGSGPLTFDRGSGHMACLRTGGQLARSQRSLALLPWAPSRRSPSSAG